MVNPHPLPLPTWFTPGNAASYGYRADATALAPLAAEHKRAHGIRAAAADETPVHLLLIDVQKDFCFPEGALYVAGRSGTGAIDDSRRIAEFICRNVGAQIQSGLGVSVHDVGASEVLLVTMMPDDSGSISSAGNAGAVRDGHNFVLEALGASTQAGEVLVHTRYLSGHVLFPYVTLDGAVKLDAQNYDPKLGTPLYDQAMVMLGTVVAKSQEFLQAGVAVRSVSLIITDGGDYGSTRTARDVKALVTDLLAQERPIVAAMGISDGTTDFRKVFQDMGIPDRWLLTPGHRGTDIRRAFGVFSRSVARVARGGAMLGGFAN